MDGSYKAGGQVICNIHVTCNYNSVRSTCVHVCTQASKAEFYGLRIKASKKKRTGRLTNRIECRGYNMYYTCMQVLDSIYHNTHSTYISTTCMYSTPNTKIRDPFNSFSLLPAPLRNMIG